jgi:hypothetical protein
VTQTIKPSAHRPSVAASSASIGRAGQPAGSRRDYQAEDDRIDLRQRLIIDTEQLHSDHQCFKPISQADRNRGIGDGLGCLGNLPQPGDVAPQFLHRVDHSGDHRWTFDAYVNHEVAIGLFSDCKEFRQTGLARSLPCSRLAGPPGAPGTFERSCPRIDSKVLAPKQARHPRGRPASYETRGRGPRPVSVYQRPFRRIVSALVDRPGRAYAWSSPIESSDKRRVYAVLGIGAIKTPLDAVRAAIVAEYRKL